ncbi:unnamed protein product [Linum tenue]|uniref:SHSP domain-containing protein n=1 Tax=Linum tenue TaxID=586396 RepID=A0AAV0QZ31_9ROSI|nr:unnamed protein product [Linum tenue]CAI0549385.1 unnamed protein product [Linum tenue]
MATVDDLAAGGIRGVMPQRARSRDHLVEEFVPSSAWDDDNHSHYLLIDLPGFRKEEVSLRVDSGGKQITVAGERLLNHNKYVYFHQTYQLPEGISDTDRITGKFDGEILYVTVPKHVPAAAAPGSPLPAGSNPDGERIAAAGCSCTNTAVAEFGKGDVEKWWERDCEGSSNSVMRRVIEMIGEHKGIVTVAVIAFAFGVLMAPKFGISPPAA